MQFILALMAFVSLNDNPGFPLNQHLHFNECVVIDSLSNWHFGKECGTHDVSQVVAEIPLAAFSPPNQHVIWWVETESCSRSFTNTTQPPVQFEEITFFVAKAVRNSSFVCGFDAVGLNQCGGVFFMDGHELIIAEFKAMLRETVTHEFLHALGFPSGEHGTLVFQLCSLQRQILRPLPL